LDDNTQLLEAERAKAPKVSADALLADKSLKAGDTFKSFCKALKDHETTAAQQTSTPAQWNQTAGPLRTGIEKYLAHFGKYSKSDQAKDENRRKLAAIMTAKAALQHQELVRAKTALSQKDEWSREDEAKAAELYLQMMLELSELDKTPKPKNLKADSEGELVMQIKNDKGKSKLVVKPISAEIPVAGFTPGGGASREMLANVMADKLQEMLGIELNAPVTKVVSIDGGKIGMEPGTMVACSAQAWSKNTRSIQEHVEDVFNAKPADQQETVTAGPEEIAAVMANVPKAEVQSQAVFDLIALHCDRHPGNFMMGADGKLIPIDHGNVLPTKAGLIGRKQYIGSSHAVLKHSPAAQEKLSPELIERIERLNTKELIDSTKAAQLEMKKATPEADKGDLDEGLANSKRSIEFLKAAASELTLAEIYDAYSDCQHDIFFTDESRKAAGFQRAIAKKLGSEVPAQIELKSLFLDAQKDQTDWAAARAKAEELGWFIGLENAEFRAWREGNLGRLLRILKEKIKRPALTLKRVPKPSKAEAVFGGKSVDVALYQRYLELGGEDLFLEIWPSPEGTRLLDLGRRVTTMEGLVGIERI
jgi:hypothetical protein